MKFSEHLVLTAAMLAFSLVIPYFIWIGGLVLAGQALYLVKGFIAAVDGLGGN